MHQPMLPAAHQPEPKPPRPSRNPNPRQSAPRSQIPPGPPRNSAADRLATYVRRHRHPQQRRMPLPENSIKSHQYPIQAKAAAPAPNPQETHPQDPRCPRPILPPPRQQQKPQPDRIGTPTHTRWWSWSKEPREIDLMCQQKLFSRLI